MNKVFHDWTLAEVNGFVGLLDPESAKGTQRMKVLVRDLAYEAGVRLSMHNPLERPVAAP